MDFARAYRVKSALQSALDSGVLAAAKLPLGAQPSEIQSAGQTFFNTSLARVSADGAVGQPTFTRAAGIVQGTVNANVDMTLASVVGYTSMSVTVQSSATSAGKGMELMLVLDVSGSMGGSKISALRTASTGLLDAIYGGAETRPDTWIGVTPFSGRVNVFDYGASWMTGTGPGWSDRLCTDRRSSPNIENDEPPSAEAFPYYFATSGYSGTATCPTPKALGLTPDRSTVQTRIDSLVSTAGTSTQVGMVWGWRMLSPKWQGLWSDASLPKSYADSPGKYVIIMTDGENFPFESDDPFTEEEADERLLRECTAMKAEGIKIFSVAFDMGSTLTSLYQQCASEPAYHYDVQTSSELIDTFKELGLTIAGYSVRLKE